MNFQATVGQRAKAQLDRFIQSRKALEQEAVSQGATVDASILDQMAQQMTKESFEEENKAIITPNLNSLTKFDNTIAPAAYLQLFEDQLAMGNISDDKEKMKFLPMLLEGKTTYFVEQLRQCNTWGEMKVKFEAEFQVDSDMIIAELRTLKTQNYNVGKYTDDFNLKIAKLTITSAGLAEHLKILYIEGLPWKLKDQLLRDRTIKQLDLSGLQAEAKRQQHVSTYIFKGSRFEDGGGAGDNSAKGGNYAGGGGNQGGGGQGGGNQGGGNQTWRRNNRQQQYVQPYRIWTNAVFGPDVEDSQAERFTSQFSSLEAAGLDAIAHEIYCLVGEKSLTPVQKHLVVGVEQALMDHIVRATRDQGTTTRAGRLNPRDLLNEAERILLRAPGGLSLRDRLARDGQLREDVLNLLRDFEHEAVTAQVEQLQQVKQQQTGQGQAGVGTTAGQTGQGGAPPSRPRTRSQGPPPAYNAPGWQTDQDMAGMALRSNFNKDEADNFAKYFGQHPDLMEGATYFGGSEKEPFIMAVSGTERDVSMHQPIKANIPHINVVIDGYKTRAMVDSGSTTTMLSTGLLDMMPELKQKVKPTSYTFMGVGENRMTYKGMLYGVKCQLAEHIVCDVTMAVFENSNPCMLIGNDLMGGPNSQLEVVAMNAGYSFYVLSDRQGHVALVQYLKNIEGVGFPPEPKANVTQAQGQVPEHLKPAQLFR